MGKARTLHMQHAFFVHFFSHHCMIRTRKCQISRFIEDVNKRWQNFFLLIRGVARGWSWGACGPPPHPCEIIVLCPYNSINQSINQLHLNTVNGSASWFSDMPCDNSGVQVPINDIVKITYM